MPKARSFDLTVIERCLIAGRVMWFYLGKLLWPGNLVFIYPRWEISQAEWWQYLFPLSALLVLIALWSLHRRWRGPLAGLLYFAGTLFPVLGFCNVYPFVFSYVADHFQYLAGLGIIALAAAGAASLLSRWRVWNRPGGYAACLVLLAILANLTWRQSQMYADVGTLYRTTIKGNPACWMAYNNLGSALHDRGRADEAVAMFRKSIEIRPDYAEAYNNLGVALSDRGQVDEAIRQYEKALELKPNYPEAYCNLGVVWLNCGRSDEAIAHFQKALEIDSNDAEAHYDLGIASTSIGQIEQSIAHYQKALEIDPDHVGAHNNLGAVLAGRGQLDEAFDHFRKAVEINPDYGQVRKNLDLTRSRREAILKSLAGKRESLRSHPDDLALLNDVAWTLATNPNASIRNGGEAVELAQRAVQLSEGREPAILGTLAAAQAEAGRFPEAVQTARKALELATKQNKRSLARSVEAQIRLYEAGTPFRDIQRPSVRPAGHP